MVLYIDSPKVSSAKKEKKKKRLLEILSKFNKVAGYKINMQKSIVFIRASNKYSKMRLRKQFHL